MARRLDYWAKADTFAWLDEREDEVFAMYFELGSVQAVVDKIAPQMNGLAKPTFYAWLHAKDGRWERYEEVREARAYQTAEEGYAIAENATQQEANAARLRFEGKMRAAEHQNRRAFGKQTSVNLQVGPGQEWLDAMKAVVASTEAEQLPEASYELLPSGDDDETSADGPGRDPSGNGNTRASGIAERETGADASDE